MSSVEPETGSHYTVLARRFRPQAFDDVVGQEHVATALRNAIRAGRVAHAYLFTGARGVGKTSTARIFAKALNCPNANDGVPCNNCEICDGVSTGNDVDVMEIDGASNNGVENIRSLRANVGVRSMRSQYKIYIIDEVHMLSTSAFNALLKTLEEPPPNVKFVFCTTEPNKVPDTILSRCQRFDFSAIGEHSIGQRLKEIAAAEGFDVDDEAVDLVARRARGSMRDSQSLFDQLLAFSEGTIHADDVHRMLGTASDELLVGLFDAMADKRPGEVLNLLGTALDAGVQAGELLDQCIGYVRDLLVTVSGGASVSFCSVGNSHRDSLAGQAKRIGVANIMAAFQILSEARNRMLRSTFTRVLLEMSLVQVALLEDLSAVSQLLSGEFPDLPTVAAVPDTAEKKNDSVDGRADSDGPVESDSSQSGQPSAVNPPSDSQERSPDYKVEFTEDQADLLLSEIRDAAGLKLSSALGTVQKAAIVPPSQLVLFLPAGASTQQKIFGQADVRSALQDLVRRLSGVAARIAIEEMEEPDSEAATEDSYPASVPSANGAHPAKELSARPAVHRSDPPAVRGSSTMRIRDDVDPEKDPFVQQVVAVFGATVVKVTDAPERKVVGREGSGEDEDTSQPSE